MTKKKKEEIIEVEVIEKSTVNNYVNEKQNSIKPYFFPRLVAYVIDIILVSIVCTGIMFLVPENENYDKYMKEYEQIQTDYIESKIDAEEYFNKSMNVVYDIDYSNVIPMIIEVVLIILYFIVFQFYNKGQTFGKKLMKLRVISTNSDKLSLNQVTYRSLIINSIFVDILIIGSLLFLGRNYYYYASLVLQVISSIIIIATLIMILFRKDGRGLHDVISSTKVIQEN